MIVVSGHQPVYLPWLGLIHKASLADVFVFMDDVQYLEQDWNNRNRIKTPQGKPLWLTVPVDLKNSPSRLLKDIRISRQDAPPRKSWQYDHWASIRMSYGKALHFSKYGDFFAWLYTENVWTNLCDLNLAILRQLFVWFDIHAELIIASEHTFKGKKSDLVLEHCLKFGADVVVTGTHGKDYIDRESFMKKDINVVFQNYVHPEYIQRFGAFTSHLSFIDLLFNCGPGSREICLRDNMTREYLYKRT